MLRCAVLFKLTKATSFANLIWLEDLGRFDFLSTANSFLDTKKKTKDGDILIDRSWDARHGSNPLTNPFG
jgi:hypothetical protein